jgi:hypothetical protein
LVISALFCGVCEPYGCGLTARYIREICYGISNSSRGVYRVLVGGPEGRRPLGIHRRKWEDNIKMDLWEMGCGGMDWIQLDRDAEKWWAFVNAVMNIRVP